MSDEKLLIHTPTSSKTIEIGIPQGRSYWLNVVDGILTQGGDLPMTEAAKLFFIELQRIAEANCPQPNEADVVDIIIQSLKETSILVNKSKAKFLLTALTDAGYQIVKRG